MVDGLEVLLGFVVDGEDEDEDEEDDDDDNIALVAAGADR